MELLSNDLNLVDEVCFLYLKLSTFFCWIKKKRLDLAVNNKIFSSEERIWENNIGLKNTKSNFFLNTKFLAIYEDIILILVVSKEEQFFFSQTYIFDYQEICRNCWNEEKHIIVLTPSQKDTFFLTDSERETKFSESNGEILFLFKNENSLKKHLMKVFAGQKSTKI